jgi:phosphatidylserine/phosphatidylglycerophosphate/cardiolipin synthase-like enzyme
MRRRKSSDGVTVNAIAGTYVVTLGLDLSEDRRKKCLGFAIQREDKTEKERYWLRGMKTFAETDPGLGPGGQASSRDHPFQSFQWADYSAKPDHEYAYTVIPMYGSPTALQEGPAVTVKVNTEAELGKPHSVFFNRGSVATQEYARVFQDTPPDELEGERQTAAYRWLSRGLEEALLAFIDRARDGEWGLKVAIYEFHWPRVLEALKAAAARGVEVEVLYDGIPDKSAIKENEKAIAEAKIKGICRPRTTGKLMHNKFFVLTRKEKPLAVWTGSTNITVTGIFGHLNCGHIIDSAPVAGEFLTYWDELCTNPEAKAERGWMGERNPRPLEPGDAMPPMTTVFSPHSGEKVLNWYRDIAASAKKALMMSFAFGMDDRFKDVYRSDDQVLRYALMDRVAMGKKERVEEEEAAIKAIRMRANVVVAIGNRIPMNSFDRWLKELPTPPGFVPWVHTKFMLVDPLGKSPITVTGSANWSGASTSDNNENMVIVNGDQRVADIYIGEFMRLHAHYAFRETVVHKGWGDTKWNPKNLVSDPSWQDDYFDPSTERYWKRLYFS